MKFSYSAVWADTVRMLRANASWLVAIAGVFFFLPALLLGHFAPQPEGAGTLGQAIADMREYFAANWHWLILTNLINMVGAIATYLLLLGAPGRTVGSALGGALPLLPSYFLLSAITNIIIFFGLFWLIVPGLYLVGRLMVSAAAMVGERILNPFAAIGRSWRLTRKRGWAVLGLLALVFIAGYVAIAAITAVLGSVFLLVGGGREGLGGMLVLILSSGLGAALSMLFVLLLAAIYRALTVQEEAAPASISGS